jgi:hypothetical protein
MIPGFNHSHVLPPFLGSDPTALSAVSPYPASMLELVERFGHLPGRTKLLDGLLRYRADLAKLGFVRGFQWLDGSFVENIEIHQQRPPNDIDVATFVYAPDGLNSGEITLLLDTHPDLFTSAKAKIKYGCDAYLVPLGNSPVTLVRRTAYYFGMFSHRRGDHVWKGILHTPLDSDDMQARTLLDNMGSGGNDAATA